MPTQTTRYNFTAANTYQYTGVSVTCPTDHTYLVRARLVYSNSEPKGIAASASSTSMNMYELLDMSETSNTIMFMVLSGGTVYIWGKGTKAAGDDVRIDILDITN